MFFSIQIHFFIYVRHTCGLAGRVAANTKYPRVYATLMIREFVHRAHKYIANSKIFFFKRRVNLVLAAVIWVGISRCGGGGAAVLVGFLFIIRKIHARWWWRRWNASARRE